MDSINLHHFHLAASACRSSQNHPPDDLRSFNDKADSVSRRPPKGQSWNAVKLCCPLRRLPQCNSVYGLFLQQGQHVMTNVDLSTKYLSSMIAVYSSRDGPSSILSDKWSSLMISEAMSERFSLAALSEEIRVFYRRSWLPRSWKLETGSTWFQERKW